MAEDAPPAPEVSVEDLINAMRLRRGTRTLELIRSGIDVNADHLGTFPLQLAIEQGDARVVQALLKAGADANKTLPKIDSMSMLVYATAGVRRNSSIVRALIQAGGELEGRDEKGRTPLMHAARAANTAALDLPRPCVPAELTIVSTRPNSGPVWQKRCLSGLCAESYVRQSASPPRRTQALAAGCDIGDRVNY